MTETEFLKFFCKKENESGCYEVKINGITAYTLMRQRFRRKMALLYGVDSMPLVGSVNKSSVWPIFISTVISSYQLLKLMLVGKKCPVVFLPFSRVEKIDGVYVDKFTDPLIDVAGIATRYVILEAGRLGVHLRPRIHSDKIVNVDVIRVLAKILSFGCTVWFKNKYKKEFKLLLKSLRQLSNVPVSESNVVNNVFQSYFEIKIYKLIFRRLKARFLLGPTRPVEPFIAGHLAKAKVCELQHGITYDETILYSGYRDSLMIPDCFMAFGNNKPSDVYGIDESKIVNIGWALQDYIESLFSEKKKNCESVLVISDPEITEVLFQVIIQMANDNPKVFFEIRPHPHEVIPERYLNSISNLHNVKIQDNKINISEALMSFNMVIGENSTVLYEALAVNKKVGKLFYDGLNPKYLVDDDKESFWEISNQTDFESFLKENVSSKKSKCIYSPFNKNIFAEIINCNA